MSTVIEELRTRVLGGAGAGILPNLQARLAEMRSPGSPEILKGAFITELREKGVLGAAMARIEKFRGGPPAKPVPPPPAPPAPEAKIGRISTESIEGRYVSPPPVYARPLVYESLSESTREWLTPEMWAELSSDQKETAIEGAGVSFEGLKRFLLAGGAKAEFVTPLKYQKGRIAVSF